MSVLRSSVRPLFAAVAIGSILFLSSSPAVAAGPPGDAAFLDTAASFSVIGGSTVTNTGPSFLNASLAVSPGSALPGFPPGLVGGATHSNNAVAIQAQVDVTTAANAIMAVPSFNVGSADLDGLTFLAGSYSSASSLLNNGTITLQGDADDVFIFTAVSTLTTGSGSTILFTGGAQECNVFWRVGSSATLGTGSRFAGTLIAQAAVSANTSATIHGRLFAQTAAVTLDSNVFTAPTCITTGGGGGSGGGVPPGSNSPQPSPSGPTGPVPPIPGAPSGPAPGAPPGPAPAALAPTGLPMLPLAAGGIALLIAGVLGAGVRLANDRRLARGRSPR